MMEDIGTEFKTAREAQRLSLEEAAAATKIKLDYLRALEEEAYDRLPPPAYLRGFIKIYARYLQLPQEPLLRQYEENRLGGEAQVAFVPPPPPPSVPWLPYLKWNVIAEFAAGLLLLGLIIMGIIKLIQGEKKAGIAAARFSVMEEPYRAESVEKLELPRASK